MKVKTKHISPFCKLLTSLDKVVYSSEFQIKASNTSNLDQITRSGAGEEIEIVLQMKRSLFRKKGLCCEASVWESIRWFVYLLTERHFSNSWIVSCCVSPSPSFRHPLTIQSLDEDFCGDSKITASHLKDSYSEKWLCLCTRKWTLREKDRTERESDGLRGRERVEIDGEKHQGP